MLDDFGFPYLLLILIAIGFLAVGWYILKNILHIKLEARISILAIRASESLGTRFRHYLKTLLMKAVRLFRLMLNWRTHEGVFLRLCFLGKYRGYGRRPGQTPREFLMAIRNNLASDDETRQAFGILADGLDHRCFGRDEAGNSKKMEARQIKLLVRAVAWPKRKRSTAQL